MQPRIRLKHVLFFTFTLIASVPVLILAGWVQQSALDKEIAAVEEKHLLVARNLTGDLERYVIDLESTLQLVAQNMVNGVNIMGLPRHLDELFFRHICITDRQGKVIKRVTSSAAPVQEQFPPQILDLLRPLMSTARSKPEKVHYSDLVRTGENETSFYLVKDMPGDQFAVAALSTTHIIETQKKVSFGRRGHVAIVDRTGRAIAHPVADWVREMKDMSFLPPVKKMMLGETGVSRFYTPAMQADMVAGFTTVPHAGWGVMVPQPFEELQEHANQVQFIAIMITLVGIAIAGLISWYMASLLSEPIQSVVDATEIGADDGRLPIVTRVSMPTSFIPHELRVLVHSFNLMRIRLNKLSSALNSKIDLANAEVKSQNKLLQQQSEELQRTNRQLEQLTIVDSLTELFNRRHFNETLEKELAYARRQNDTFSLMMIDLDHFKDINDEHGHTAGDKVLKDVAVIIKNNVRKSDIVCRVGGEEIAIIFRHTGNDNVAITAESLRKTIGEHTVMHYNTPISVTASIGIVTYPGDYMRDCTAEDLYRYADQAMYSSKKQGRNRITHYADIVQLKDRKSGAG